MAERVGVSVRDKAQPNLNGDPNPCTLTLTLLRDVCPLRVPLSFSKSMGREPSVMAVSQSRVKWIWDGVVGKG